MGRKSERRYHVEAQMQTVSTLTPLQRRWLIEYLSQTGTPNATQAYIDAGGTAQNPGKVAYKIRHHPDVIAAIDEYFHAQEMSAREVVARLSEQAAAVYGQYLHYDPERGEIYCDLEQLLADGYGHLIKKVGYDRTGTESAVQVVEFYDAHTALVDVGKYHGLFGPSGSEDDPLHTRITYITENRPNDDQSGD